MTDINGAAMNSSYSYQITLQVSAADGRSDSTDISVQSLPVGSPYTEMLTSSAKKFNADQNMSLSGLIQASVDSTTSWSVLIAGQNVSIASFSPLDRSLPGDLTANGMVASLLLAANTFSGGSYVTFRITATSFAAPSRRLQGLVVQAAPVVTSYSEITLISNIPPTNGLLSVSPTSGKSLSTKFTLESLDWIDDPADYPLSYDFQYTLASDSPYLSCQARSPLNSVTTDFPAGLQGYQYIISVIGRAYDSLGAYGTGRYSIEVTADADIDISAYLSTNLLSSINSGDTNAAFQTVNNVASTINVVNCTAAPPAHCQGLNRLQCLDVPNTCSACLSGYIGISGPANTKCFATNTTDGSLGAKCMSDGDCLYGYCKSFECAVPVKTCPTEVPGATCSGHGACRYADGSDSVMDKELCLITNTFCKVNCECLDGFGGASCALDPTARLSRDTDRGTLCNAINTISNVSDASPQLLESLAGSLLASYVPAEVITDQSTSSCQDALVVIASLSSQGYLAGASPDTSSYLIKSLSSFVSPGNDSSKAALVAESLSNITQGMLLTMTNGQDPIQLLADNIQITMRKDLKIDLANVTLSPPQSAAEVQYHSPPMTLAFAGDAAQNCANGDDYVQFSIMKWGSNPFPNSSDVLSPILRMQSTGAVTVDNLSTTAVDAPVAYFMTLQFSAVQNFNFNLTPAQAMQLPPSNFTFPECSFQTGEAYSSCNGCNISSYTNSNVTFACRDIGQLCASGATGLGRVLQASSGMQTSQYAALFVAIAGVLESVLSSNPFAVNIEQAKVVLSLVGSIVLVLVGGAVYFHKWDNWDRNQLIYLAAWPPKVFNTQEHKQAKMLPTPGPPLQAAKKMTKAVSFRGDIVAVPVKDAAPRTMSKRKVSQLDSKVSIRNLMQTIADKAAEEEQIKQTKRAARKTETDMSKFLISGSTSFYDLAVPNLFQQNAFHTFLTVLIARHDYTTIFLKPSVRYNRLLRWLELWKSILIGLFIDTVFFSVFYANDGTCESYVDQEACLTGMNAITAAPSCVWEAASSTCSLAPPPDDLAFSLILALVCVLVGVPVDMLFTYILTMYAAKRPVLEQVGLDSRHWLGTSTASDKQTNGNESKLLVRKSLLCEEFESAERCWSAEARKTLLSTSTASLAAYNSFLTLDEEYALLLRNILSYEQEYQSISLDGCAEDLKRELYCGHRDALCHFLGMHPDGSLKPLLMWEYFYYGSARTKLLCKLKAVRRQTRAVTESIAAAAEYSPEMQEVSLLQHFVLEQFNPFQKWVLQNQLFCFESFSPEEIDAIPWFAAWTAVLGSLGFFVNWILAWGVQSGTLFAVVIPTKIVP